MCVCVYTCICIYSCISINVSKYIQILVNFIKKVSCYIQSLATHFCTSCYITKILLYCSMSEHFLRLNCCIMSHCLTRSQLIHPLSFRWACELIKLPATVSSDIMDTLYISWLTMCRTLPISKSRTAGSQGTEIFNLHFPKWYQVHRVTLLTAMHWRTCDSRS